MSYWYHVFIEFKKPRHERVGACEYGLTEDQVQNLIAKPYNANRSFWFLGATIHPSEIETIHIFLSTEKDISKIALPNGKQFLTRKIFATY